MTFTPVRWGLLLGLWLIGPVLAADDRFGSAVAALVVPSSVESGAGVGVCGAAGLAALLDQYIQSG